MSILSILILNKLIKGKKLTKKCNDSFDKGWQNVTDRLSIALTRFFFCRSPHWS